VTVFEQYPAPPPPAPEPVEEAPPPPPEVVHYETKYPFVPPDVQVYYEPPRPVQPPVLPALMPSEARQYVHMETFYSEPPMARTEVYPQPGVAYEARETVKTISDMGKEPGRETAEQAQQVEKSPPVVEEEIKKAVRFSDVSYVIYVVIGS